MYVDRIRHTQPNGKIYTQYLLRTSRREGEKTIKTTILNITNWGNETCEAIAYAIKNRQSIAQLIAESSKRTSAANDPASLNADLSYDNIRPVVLQGKSIGAVWLLSHLAAQLGVTDALGDTREGRLALWQILARTIDQGSRLSAARLARSHEIDFLQLGKFNEDLLYDNLDWLAEHQSKIEKRLYNYRYNNSPCTIFLYDVTSSYFEGVENELAAYGYNRDKKRGKLQIVVGLLCAGDGTPISVEVFEGNTNDTKTMHNQIKKASEQFHAQNVVFVGDRGMIKKTQQKELTEIDFDFITALTRVQVEKLLKQNVLEISFFDEQLFEVILDNTKRYILRRNPIRATEIADSRTSKLSKLREIINKRNDYLNKHSRAKVEVVLNYCNDKSKRLKVDGWVSLKLSDSGRVIEMIEDEEKLRELSRLDGCYCLTTSLTAEELDKENIHARYKDLAKVEHAFRTCKTGHLEMRPIYVRKSSRTRGHVFVVMLSYLLTQKLRECWGGLDLTVEEGIRLLETLGTIQLQLQLPNQKDKSKNVTINSVPTPREDVAELFRLVNIPAPEFVPAGKIKQTNPVDSKKKLKTRRKP